MVDSGVGRKTLNTNIEISTSDHHKDFEPFKVALLGGSSGMLMEVMLHPLDTIRTRMKANQE